MRREKWREKIDIWNPEVSTGCVRVSGVDLRPIDLHPSSSASGRSSDCSRSAGGSTRGRSVIVCSVFWGVFLLAHIFFPIMARVCHEAALTINTFISFFLLFFFYWLAISVAPTLLQAPPIAQRHHPIVDQYASSPFWTVWDSCWLRGKGGVA